MGFAFNPFTGNFDVKGAGGGGGASYIDGEVQNFSALPQTVGSPAVDSAYLVREAEGTWLLGRKPAGIYIRTANTGTRASDWTYAGEFPDVFNDANFVLYDDADSTKNAKFQLSSIATGTTRTITVPNNNVTLPDQGTSTTDSPTFADLSVTGSFDAGSFVTGGTVNVQGGALFVDDGAPNVEFGVPLAFANGAEADSRTNLGLGTAATSASTDFVAVSTVDAKGDLLVGTAADTVARLAVGATNGMVLTVDSAEAGGMKWAAASGGGSGGTKTYATFTATDNNPPATDFATIDQRNSVACLDFSDTATESAVFVGIMPEAASLGSGLIVRLHWMGTATTGNVRWSVAFERGNTDLDADSFDTATAATATTNGTSGIVTVTAITCTSIDSIAAGDLFRLRVQRLGADAADTMAGAKGCELVAVEVRSAA